MIRSAGRAVADFIERHCRFTNGRWAGQPFRLADWESRLLDELFELRADGRRRYRWALIGLPKKNGKSELVAALSLYFLLGDGEVSPLVSCAATADDQAAIAKGLASFNPDPVKEEKDAFRAYCKAVENGEI